MTGTAQELVDALLEFDADRSHALLDRQLVERTPDAVLAELVLPALREIGDRWECGDASVAQEHFASNLLRATLLSVARRWDMGRGRRALLACAPGELHDLPLIAFGVALHRRGWRILFLGTDTPLEMVASAANALGPDLVVVSSSVERDVSADELAPLAAGRRLLLGGTWPQLDALEAERLGGDPVVAAAAVAG